MDLFAKPRPWTTAVLLSCAALVVAPAGAQDSTFESARDVQQEISQAARQTQQRIDQLSRKAQKMLRQYRQARDRTASLKIFNQQLAQQVASQEEEIASLKAQLAHIAQTRRKFVPFMVQMIDTLEQFIARDIPFLIEERKQRVRDLRALMAQADVSTAEKFRQIMQAYQTEIKYGHTIGTYQGKLTINGQTRTVQFLRIGRVALLYQTLNGRRTGFWNPNTGEWESADEYRRAVEQAILIASEQAAPGLLHVPLPAPEEKTIADLMEVGLSAAPGIGAAAVSNGNGGAETAKPSTEESADNKASDVNQAAGDSNE